MPTGGEKHDSPSTRATFRRYFRSTSRRRTSCPPLRNVANEWLIERRFRSNDDLKRQWMDRDVRGAIVSLKWECDSVGSGDKRTPSMPEIVVRVIRNSMPPPVLSASCHSAQEIRSDDYHFILIGRGMPDPMRAYFANDEESRILRVFTLVHDGDNSIFTTNDRCNDDSVEESRSAG